MTPAAGVDAIGRRCKAKGCGRIHLRPRAPYCESCAAERMRTSRAAATASGVARRAQRILNAEQRAYAVARAQVWVYLRRGKIEKAPCACGRRDVVPTWADLARPLDVVWRCRGHAEDFRRDQRAAARAAAARPAVAIADLPALIAALPPAAQERARVFARDLRVGGFVKRLDPESPLYRQRLAQAVDAERRILAAAADGSAAPAAATSPA